MADETDVSLTDHDLGQLVELEKDPKVGVLAKALASVTSTLNKVLSGNLLKSSEDGKPNDKTDEGDATGGADDDDDNDKNDDKDNNEGKDDYSGENDDNDGDPDLQKSLLDAGGSLDPDTAQLLGTFFEEAVEDTVAKFSKEMRKSLGVMLTKHRADLQSDLKKAIATSTEELRKSFTEREETLQKSIDLSGRQPVPNVMLRKSAYQIQEPKDPKVLDKETITNNLLKAIDEKRIDAGLAREITDRVASGAPLTSEMAKIAAGI